MQSGHLLGILVASALEEAKETKEKQKARKSAAEAKKATQIKKMVGTIVNEYLTENKVSSTSIYTLKDIDNSWLRYIEFYPGQRPDEHKHQGGESPEHSVSDSSQAQGAGELGDHLDDSDSAQSISATPSTNLSPPLTPKSKSAPSKLIPFEKLIETIYHVFLEMLKQKGLQAAFENEETIKAAILAVLAPLNRPTSKANPEDTTQSLEAMVRVLDQFILDQINSDEATDRIRINASSEHGDFVYFFDKMRPKDHKNGEHKEAKEKDLAAKKFRFIANCGLLPDNEILSNKLINIFGKRAFDLLHDKARSNDDEKHLSYRKKFSRYFGMSHTEIDPYKQLDIEINWVIVELIRATQPIELLLNTTNGEFQGDLRSIFEEVKSALKAMKGEKFPLLHKHLKFDQCIDGILERLADFERELGSLKKASQPVRNDAIRKGQRDFYTSLISYYRAMQSVQNNYQAGQQLTDDPEDHLSALLLLRENVSNSDTRVNAEYGLQEHVQQQHTRMQRSDLWLETNGGIQIDSRAYCHSSNQRKELLHGICFAETFSEADTGDGYSGIEAPHRIINGTVKPVTRARKLYRTKQAEAHTFSKEASKDAPGTVRKLAHFIVPQSVDKDTGLPLQALENRHLLDNNWTKFKNLFANEPCAIYRFDKKDSDSFVNSFNSHLIQGDALVMVCGKPKPNNGSRPVEYFFVQNHNKSPVESDIEIELPATHYDNLAPNENGFVARNKNNARLYDARITSMLGAWRQRAWVKSPESALRDALDHFALTPAEQKYFQRKEKAKEVIKPPETKVLVTNPQGSLSIFDPPSAVPTPSKELKEVKTTPPASIQEVIDQRTTVAPKKENPIAEVARLAAKCSTLTDFSHTPLPNHSLKPKRSDDAFSAVLEFVNQFFLFFDRDVMAKHPYLGLAFFAAPYANIALPLFAASMSGAGVVGKFGSLLHALNSGLLATEAGLAKYTGVNFVLSGFHTHQQVLSVSNLKAATEAVTEALSWATLAEGVVEKALVGCFAAKLIFNLVDLIVNNPAFAEHNASLIEQYWELIMPDGLRGSLADQTWQQKTGAIVGGLLKYALELAAGAYAVGAVEHWAPSIISSAFNELATVPWDKLWETPTTIGQGIQCLAVAKAASLVLLKMMGIMHNVKQGNLLDVDGFQLREDSPSMEVLRQFVTIVHDDEQRALFLNKAQINPEQYKVLRSRFEELLARNPSLWEQFRGPDGEFGALKELGVTKLESKWRYKLTGAVVKGLTVGVAKFLIGLPALLFVVAPTLIGCWAHNLCFKNKWTPPQNQFFHLMVESAELFMKLPKLLWTGVKTCVHATFAVAARILSLELPMALLFIGLWLPVKMVHALVWGLNRVGEGLKWAWNNTLGPACNWVKNKVSNTNTAYMASPFKGGIPTERISKVADFIVLVGSVVQAALRYLRYNVENIVTWPLTQCRNFFVRPLENELQAQAAVNKKEPSSSARIISSRLSSSSYAPHTPSPDIATTAVLSQSKPKKAGFSQETELREIGEIVAAKEKDRGPPQEALKRGLRGMGMTVSGGG